MRKTLFLFFLFITLFVLSSCNEQGELIITLPTETEPIESNPLETIPSEPIETIPTEPLTLDVPENILIYENTLSWNAVNNADSYIIQVGEIEYVVNNLYCDLSTLIMIPGSYELVVIATNGTLRSEPSISVSYVVETPLEVDALMGQLLQQMNEEYTLDMTIDDFDDQNSYTDYVLTVNLVRSYVKASIELGMSEIDTVGFFHDTMTFAQDVPQMDTFTTMLSEMNMFNNYQMTPEMISLLLYELALGAIDTEIIRNEVELTHYGNMTFSEFSFNMSSLEYTEFYEALLSYAEPSHVDAIDALFFKIELSNHQELLSVFYDAGNSYIQNGNYELLDYSWITDETLLLYIYDLVDLVDSMYTQGYSTELEIMLSNDFVILENVYQDYLFYISYVSNIDRFITQIEQLQSIKEVLISEKEIILDSLEIVIDYVMTIEETLSLDLLNIFDTLLAGNLLSNEEILLLKNEVIYLLQTNLPSSEEFSLLYEVLYYISSAVSNADLSMFESHTAWMGEATYTSLDLMFSFIGQIDLDMIAYLQNFTDELYIIQYDPYYQENFIAGINYLTILDLVIYMSDYCNLFVSENQDQLLILEGLLTPIMIEPLYISILDYAIEQVTLNEYLSDLEKTEYIELFELYQQEFNTIISAVDVLKQISSVAVDELVLTELMSFILSIDESLNLDTILTNANIYVSELVLINYVMMNELDQESILALLDLVRLPIFYEIKMNDPDVDVEQIYIDIREDLAQLIANLIVLETDLLNLIDAFDFDILYSIDGTVLVSQIFNLVDNFLDAENEALIISSITLLFDEILAQPDLLGYLGGTLTEIEQLKVDMIAILESYIDEFKVMASWDFDNLTPEQYEVIESLFEVIKNMLLGGGLPIDPPFDQAIPLSINEPISNFIPEEGFVYYEFKPQETNIYTIDSKLIGSGYSAELLIIDDNFNLIASIPYEDNEKILQTKVEIELLIRHTYFIGIVVSYEYMPYYGLEIYPYQENQLHVDEAIPVTLNETISSFPMVFEELIYSFTAETTGVYHIYSSPTTENHFVDPYLMLYDQDMMFIGLYDDDHKFNLNFHVPELLIEAGETYYFVISAYQMNIEEVPFIISTTPMEPVFPDFGIPFEDAIPITANQVIAVPSGYDESSEFGVLSIYEFIPELSTYYDIFSILPDDVVAAECHIVDSNFDILESSNIHLHHNFSFLHLFLNANSTYYILIYGFSYEPNELQLVLYETALLPQEFSDSFETAHPIYPNDFITLTMTDEGSSYYIFNPQITGYYEVISLIENDLIDPVIDLFDSNQNWLTTSDNDDSSNNFYLEYYFVEGETYYFQIWAYNEETVTFDFYISNPKS